MCKNPNKKEQKAENAKQRNFWPINPETRVAENKKKYNRKREKQNWKKETN